ncbi:Vanillate O-demethylase oxidoreductase [Pandoraea terrae]|uniref:Vanillate O-demethylase oxidoreductase n=1 Tax=Pandoraea terrae TaxID=1537710 RepID=A0A5E4WIK1_9BURK|nr:Vanillate O-demethylase oxidoreductase [Pandoraea terrae]
MKPTLRTVILQAHRWTGLTVGLVVVLMALTGAAIVFRPNLEPVLNRDLLTVPACTAHVPLDTLAANAAAMRPAATLDYVRIIAAHDNAVRMPAAMVRFTDQHFIYLNPCTGAVLGERARYGGVLGVIEQVHRFRFMKHGSLITGTSAILFGVVLIIGGIALWWPRTWYGLKRAAKFTSGVGGVANTRHVHKTVGLYVSLIVLSCVLTGLPQAFDWYAHGIYTIAGSPQPAKPPKSTVPAGVRRLPLETLWQTAKSLVPAPQDALMHIPHKPRDSVEMYLIDHDAPHPNARTILFLDAYTGKILRFTPYADSSPGHKVYFWTLSWHTGAVGGMFGQLLLLLGVLAVPVLAYTGIKSYVRRSTRPSAADAGLTVRVVRKSGEGAGICTFELAEPSGKALPPFTAGAHIDVQVGHGLLRQYSLCNDPRETHRYLIAVLRAPQSRGGSMTLHDTLDEGDLLEIGVPKNHFPLASSARRSLLLAGGIGVTPIICMAERLACLGADFEMHYCTRSRERTAFAERIAQADYANRVTHHFSDGPAEQRLDLTAVLDGQPPGTHLYVCGPSGFMDTVISTALQRGWPAAQLHREYFASASREPAPARAFDVKLASTGKVYRIPEHKTIVASLAECGIEIPTSCEQGICGTCVTRVIEGDVEHLDSFLTAAEREKNNQLMPCCSRANSALLVLDL